MTEDNRIDPAYPYIDNKFKSLKGQITRLRNQVESLEIMGLQEQITSINSRVEQFDSILLSLERDIAQTRISHHLHWALWALGDTSQSVDAESCIRYARELATSAMTESRDSTKPHECYSRWYSKCAEYFKRHGHPGIFI
jgi:chromosome segregation ATPase